MEQNVQIGEVAEKSGVSAKMIRHYESIGLIPAPPRRDSNYRDYGHHDVHRLAFVRRARDLGFALEEIADLLRLWDDRDRSSADVKRLTESHIAELDARIDRLRQMRRTLSNLAQACNGNARPDCPILDDLAGSHA